MLRRRVSRLAIGVLLLGCGAPSGGVTDTQSDACQLDLRLQRLTAACAGVENISRRGIWVEVTETGAYAPTFAYTGCSVVVLHGPPMENPLLGSGEARLFYPDSPIGVYRFPARWSDSSLLSFWDGIHVHPLARFEEDSVICLRHADRAAHRLHRASETSVTEAVRAFLCSFLELSVPVVQTEGERDDPSWTGARE